MNQIPSKVKNLIGNEYNRLTVLSYSRKENNKHLWMCECICGNIKELNSGDIKSNKVRSCGCLKEEELKKRFTTHGFTKNKSYQTWKHIKQRCLNENCKSYHKYGGCGINICDRWLIFENFLFDMGEPKEGQSIDRIDNDKGYFKENCRWATSKEQCRNKKFNIKLTHDNQTKCVSEWAEIYNICKDTIYYRFKKGWSHEECIFGKHCLFNINHNI